MKDEKSRQDETSKLEFIEQVENTIIGLIAFGKRFFVTIIAVAFSPSQFGKHLRERPHGNNFVKPYTFLVISTFPFIKIVRFIMVSILVWVNVTLKGCHPKQDTPQTNLPNFNEYLVIPSIEEITIIGLSMIIVVSIMTWVLRIILTKSAPELKPIFIKGACYAIGIQYLFYLLLLCVFYGTMRTIEFQPVKSLQCLKPVLSVLSEALNYMLNFVIEFDYAIEIIVPLLLIWPAIILSRLVMQQIPEEKFRISRILYRRLVSGSMAMIFCASTFIVSFGVPYSFAKFDEKGKYKFIPVIQVVLLEKKEISEHPTEITLSILNKTGDLLLFDSNDITFIAEDNWAYKGTLTDWEKAPAPVISIPARGSTWLTVKLTRQDKRDKPLLEESKGRVILKQIESSEERTKIKGNLWKKEFDYSAHPLVVLYFSNKSENLAISKSLI